MYTFRADSLGVLFSLAMSDILKARKSKVSVEFLPATFFVWFLCTGWLFGLSYKMPNFFKLESQLYEYLTMHKSWKKKTKKLLIHFFRYLVYEIFLWPESWWGSMPIYFLSLPWFWTLPIKRFLFWSILNSVILKISNIQSKSKACISESIRINEA